MVKHKIRMPRTFDKETKAQFQIALTSWFDAHQRVMPWRESRDAYRIWVSEVMLQQTQVKTVIPYFNRFVQRFPTVETLAASPIDPVLKLWEGLGYYARARNLHRAAGLVKEEWGGILPVNRDDLLSLPGIGPYIAAAVLSIAHGVPLAVVDGNVKRVLARLMTLTWPANDAAMYSRFQAVADDLLDPADPGRYNQGFMELGALICTPKTPECSRCPVRGMCRSFQTGRTGEFPRRRKRKPVPVRRISAGIVWRDGRCLITRRKPEGLLGGLWEFPGGKIQPGESEEAACIREISEETGLEVRVTRQLTTVDHAYTHFKIHMTVFECRWVSGTVRLNGPVDHSWIRPEEIPEYAFPKANHKFIHLIQPS